MRIRARSFLLVTACAAVACSDPTHDEAVAALGGEAPGVPPSALHRPGQPCVTCHGNAGPASPEFSLAGTIYALPREGYPAPNAVVLIEDFTGTVGFVGTNAAGNFYVLEEDWAPAFPLKIKVTLGNLTKQMTTYVARARSCADCHTNAPSPTSPGHVYVAANASDLPTVTPGP